MKIIKYLLLLFFLISVAFFVHIATQESTYSISKNIFINAPKDFTYNYIDNLKNWEEWQPYKETESKIYFEYDSIIKGNNAGFSWYGSNLKGSLHTLETFDKDSIYQNITLNDNTYSLLWNFKDVNSGTQLTLKLNGKKDFLIKIKDFFNGKSESKFDKNIFKSLENIKNNLNKELTKYSIDTIGTVDMEEIYYIFEKGNSKSDYLADDIIEKVAELNTFAKEHSLKQTGKPFIILEDFSDKNNINYSICIPIEEEIFTTEESKIKGVIVESTYAYKSVLKGDYSHFTTALKDTKKAILNLEEKEDFSKKIILVLETSLSNTNKPSEWITNIFVPLEKKPEVYYPKTEYNNTKTEYNNTKTEHNNPKTIYKNPKILDIEEIN